MAPPLSDPFPLTPPPTPAFVGKGRLQTLLEEKINEKKKNTKGDLGFDKLGIALVDMTTGGKTGPFQYAGIRDEKDSRAFSLAKIGVMFAGYRLRDRIRLAGQGLKATGPDDVFQQITADWKSKVETKSPELWRDFPVFKDIFKVSGASGAWKFNFTETGESWEQLDIMHGEHGVSNAMLAKLGFLERIKLMIAHSDNGAAGSCVRQIGYQYLNGALVAEGFQQKGRNKTGLWIGSDYVGIRRAGYVPPMPPAPIPDLTQGATAKVVAALLTALAQEKLLDSDSSLDMLEWMDYAVGTRSFWDEGLTAAKRSITRINRKIGMGAVQGEGGLIERTNGTKNLRYVAVAVGSVPVKPLQDLIVVMDDAIIAHNTPPAPTP